MKVSLKPTARLVRTMLSGHSGIGLAVAALLYIICVSGTFSVFYQDFERWEQPLAPEYEAVTPAQVSAAAKNAYETELAASGEKPDHVWLGLPTKELPRFVAHAGDTNGHLNADGSLGEAVDHEWTHFLVGLHYALTLPSFWGLTLVGIAGVLVISLIISGLLAHPNLFRDAFSLRLGRNRRLQQVDLHNRLSVWTAPFLFIIALTGALIGLAQVLIFAMAALFFGGDTTRAAQSLFLSHGEPTEEAAPLADVATAYREFLQAHPDMQPLGVTIHEPGTAAQMVEISALVPNRIVWSEMFGYDAQGKFTESAGWSNGEVGTQIYASMYRLHFGHFGGLPVKILYTLLGLAMCYVAVSGVNIWLIRKRSAGAPAERLERLWLAIVWGTPLGIAVSAIGYAGAQINPVAIFWGSLIAVAIPALLFRDLQHLSRVLRAAVALASLLVVVQHFILHGAAAFGPAGFLVNGLWLLLALTLGGTLLPVISRQRDKALRPLPAAETS